MLRWQAVRLDGRHGVGKSVARLAPGYLSVGEAAFGAPAAGAWPGCVLNTLPQALGSNMLKPDVMLAVAGVA